MCLTLPNANVSIRPATMDDIAFIDSLQKIHREQVGWMPTTSLEQKIAAGQVLVAESDEATERRSDEGEDSAASFPSSLIPVGYLIGSDQYFKRDDVGIIYQLNVVPGKQRAFVGAALLKAQFERSAYGCRLYCCWCAQDIEANHFWEAMGFVPLAFRAGGRGKSSPSVASSLRRSVASSRVHIFWQKRIVEGDETTPWWFPSKTNAGSIREDRIVLPIPPGVRWCDEMPVLETSSVVSRQLSVDEKTSGVKKIKAIEKPRASRRNGLWFAMPMPDAPKEKPAKEKVAREKHKADPRLASAARELRDRWLERVNADPVRLNGGGGKYQIQRAFEPSHDRTRLLPAA